MQENGVQPQTAESSAKALEEQLREAQVRIDEMQEQHRDAMLRAMADAENARKRFQAEAASAQKFALERFAEQLLPVADSLEAALDTLQAGASFDPASLRDGVQITLRQLFAAFQKAHVSQIAPAPGERFDPHRHQAMAAVEADSEPNTIVAVMQKGYLIHDRVIRPALVTVAKAVEKEGASPISSTDSD